MRIISFNANGIRSATEKGFFRWLARQDADVVCLQETKAHEHQLADRAFRPRGWHVAHRGAMHKKGYSGVAIYTRREPDSWHDSLGWTPFDDEGRYLEARFGELSVVSLYLPSGSSGEQRQAFKFAVLDWFLPILDGWLASGRQYVVCGDWNIAHRPIDLKNWRSNQKNSGFLPEERAWLDKVLREGGWLDSYRTLKPEGADYTWWSNRGQARAKNVGWRIDYQIATPNLGACLRDCSIYRRRWFSDHAPYIVDYDLTKARPGAKAR
jgi:exodeoxyribonuclease-3